MFRATVNPTLYGLVSVLTAGMPTGRLYSPAHGSCRAVITAASHWATRGNAYPGMSLSDDTTRACHDNPGSNEHPSEDTSKSSGGDRPDHGARADPSTIIANGSTYDSTRFDSNWIAGTTSRFLADGHPSLKAFPFSPLIILI